MASLGELVGAPQAEYDSGPSAQARQQAAFLDLITRLAAITNPQVAGRLPGTHNISREEVQGLHELTQRRIPQPDWSRVGPPTPPLPSQHPMYMSPTDPNAPFRVLRGRPSPFQDEQGRWRFYQHPKYDRPV